MNESKKTVDEWISMGSNKNDSKSNLDIQSLV